MVWFQTFTRRVDKLSEPTIIFVDECHVHCQLEVIGRILETFPDALKLLFTATSKTKWRRVWRCSRWPNHWQTYFMAWLIIVLAQPRLLCTSCFRCSKLKPSAGDYDEESIRDAFKPKIYLQNSWPVSKVGQRWQAIAYTYNVESADWD